MYETLLIYPIKIILPKFVSERNYIDYTIEFDAKQRIHYHFLILC